MLEFRRAIPRGVSDEKGACLARDRGVSRLRKWRLGDLEGLDVVGSAPSLRRRWTASML